MWRRSFSEAASGGSKTRRPPCVSQSAAGGRRCLGLGPRIQGRAHRGGEFDGTERVPQHGRVAAERFQDQVVGVSADEHDWQDRRRPAPGSNALRSTRVRALSTSRPPCATAIRPRAPPAPDWARSGGFPTCSTDIRSRGKAAPSWRACRPAPRSPKTLPAPYAWGAVSLARPGEDDCGDAWRVRRLGEDLSVLVVDGLGHGPLAADAARAGDPGLRVRPGTRRRRDDRAASPGFATSTAPATT